MIRLPDHILAALERGTVILPTQQRAYAARLAFAAVQLAGGRRVWQTPQLLTASAWLKREVERVALESRRSMPRTLESAEEWLLWRQCAAEAASNLELLDPGALANALRRASELAAEYLIADAPSFGAEAALLRTARNLFDRECRSLGAAPVATLGRDLAGQIGGEVVAAGFSALTPALRALGVTSAAASATPLCVPRGIVAHGSWDEQERIAAWCQQRITDQPDTRLLVVLPGSAGARERLATLIRQAVSPGGWLSAGAQSLVAIEGGVALSELPAVRHALTGLKALSGDELELDELSEWLRGPYWRVADSQARAHLDCWLRGCGLARGALRDWTHALEHAPAPVSSLARPWLAQLAVGCRSLSSGRMSPRRWSERFRDTLEALGWPGDPDRSSGEQQTVQRCFELLDEFGQLTASRWNMDCVAAARLFADLAAATAFRPADDDSVVTVTASLSDPVVTYDGIWVAGLHSETFPQPVSPDAFVPFTAQIAAGVPAASAAGRLTEAAALLGSWRRATGELIISAPARADDLQLLPSPLWAHWLESAPDNALSRTSVWFAERFQRPDQTQCCIDERGLPWNPHDSLPSGTRTVELQNLCAFRAYAELRLGSSALEAPEPGVAPDVRGRMLHSALEKLWQQLGDSRSLAALTLEALDELIERVVTQAATAVLRDTRANDPQSPLLLRERRRAARLIRNLCRLELERAPFSVEAIESQRTIDIGRGRMSVRIDRIDRLESGGRAILDYKSGRRLPADWYGERPSHPQLMVYLAALRGDAAALATVNVTAREVRFDGIATSESVLPKVRGVKPAVGSDPLQAWQDWTRLWQERVGKLADDFLEGRAAVDPKPGACRFCHVISLCRIADRWDPAAEEAELLEEIIGGSPWSQP